MAKNRDWQIIKLAFMAAVASVGGWSVFRGLTSYLPLEGQPGWIWIAFGLVFNYIVYKLGWASYE